MLDEAKAVRKHEAQTGNGPHKSASAPWMSVLLERTLGNPSVVPKVTLSRGAVTAERRAQSTTPTNAVDSDQESNSPMDVDQEEKKNEDDHEDNFPTQPAAAAAAASSSLSLSPSQSGDHVDLTRTTSPTPPEPRFKRAKTTSQQRKHKVPSLQAFQEMMQAQSADESST